MSEIERFELADPDCLRYCYGGISKMELVEGDYHIPDLEWVRFSDHEQAVRAAVAERDARIEELEAKLDSIEDGRKK